MSKFFQLALVTSCIFLAACLPWGSDEQEFSEPLRNDGETAQEDSVPRETPNVTYQGIVQPAGISIYQQGSHRLVLDDERFILLESDQVDLNGYVGEDVEVFGSIRPTVEEGGIIMNVENIRLETQGSETATGATSETGNTASVTEGSGGENVGSEPEVTREDPQEVAGEPEVTPPAEDTTGADAAVVAGENEPEDELLDSDVNVPTSAPPSSDKLESIIAMSKDSYAPERWTQQYCTGHIGFCMPVHKNWWYKSFGNTTTSLWQVEMLNMQIESIGDGVIAVKLIAGSVASKGATDRQVRVQGDQVIGYRSWEGDTHFEVIADARLVEPVTYITEHVTAYQEE